VATVGFTIVGTVAGKRREEHRAGLQEAVDLVLEANRVLAEERLGSRVVIREPLRITA
jgi:hypothetical protein